MNDIYVEHGYKNRKDYLISLADEYGVSINTVLVLAAVLGTSEDFDGLLIALEDDAILANAEEATIILGDFSPL